MLPDFVPMTPAQIDTLVQELLSQALEFLQERCDLYPTNAQMELMGQDIYESIYALEEARQPWGDDGSEALMIGSACGVFIGSYIQQPHDDRYC